MNNSNHMANLSGLTDDDMADENKITLQFEQADQDLLRELTKP
jgi:hypothetical protein